MDLGRKAGAFLVPRIQDHSYPFLSPDGLRTAGRGGAALPSLLHPKTGSCCWRTTDSQKQQGFSSQERLVRMKTSASSTFPKENFNFSQAKAWRLSFEKKPEASTTSFPLSTAMKERITCIKLKQVKPQQIKPYSSSIKGKRKAGYVAAAMPEISSVRTKASSWAHATQRHSDATIALCRAKMPHADLV